MSNRHANNLELFLDLVFVFAVTQVTSFVGEHLTATGIGKGAVLAFLVWWQWTAFTWVGTAVDLQNHTVSRLVVLAMIPATLVMAITVPLAFDGAGVWFAGSYMVVQLFVLGLQGSQAWPDQRTRLAFARYVPLAAMAPTVLLVGGFTNGNVRVATFAAVVALVIGSAMLGGSGGGGAWQIDAVHFAERHALFIIICLGEVLVAIGATAATIVGDRGIDGAMLGGIVVAVAGAAAYWWTYFAFVPRVVEHLLQRSEPSQRGRVARDVCSFGHFAFVAGIIVYAIAAKHLVMHPTQRLAVPDRWLLCVSCALMLGGFAHVQWRAVRSVSSERLALIPVVGLLGLLAATVPGVVIFGLYAAAWATAATLIWRRFLSSDMAREMTSDG